MWRGDLLLHTEQPILGPVEPGSSSSGLQGFDVGDHVGNPLYSIVDEHVLVGALLVLVPLLVWGGYRIVGHLADRGVPAAVAIRDRFSTVPLRLGVASVLVAISALVHLMLAFTHEPSGYTVAYVAGALALGWASWLLSEGKRRLPAAILVGSVVAFWFLGAPPDQVGIATKLIELSALMLLVAPSSASARFRRVGPVAVVFLVVVTGVAAWIGAFATVGDDGGHHGGEFPDPGTLVPYIERLEPTIAESEFAQALWQQTVEAIEPYRDVAVAEAAGYEVGTVHGTDHHAQNPDLIGDGRILDPSYPESLIYAESAAGPILVGVMFETDGIGKVGPSDGGPIMLWHGHENVCLGLFPPSLAGLEGPYGLCPVGSLNLPVTGEMLHAWTLPGVPVEDRWGHLDDGWLDEYLANVAGAVAVDPSP